MVIVTSISEKIKISDKLKKFLNISQDYKTKMEIYKLFLDYCKTNNLYRQKEIMKDETIIVITIKENKPFFELCKYYNVDDHIINNLPLTNLFSFVSNILNKMNNY